MKTLSILFFFLASLSVSSTAQTEKLVAVFGDAKKIWTATQEISASEFQLQISPDQLAIIRQQANDMGNTLSLTLTPVEGISNQYACRLSVPYSIGVEYLFKMFTLFGIEEYQLQGTKKPIQNLLNTPNQ